jgi:hypothetical protein
VFIKLKGRSKQMKNHERYHIEEMGQLPTDPDKLKDLQADVRRLPGFEGRGIAATNVITRDFFAILKDKFTGEIMPYYGTREGFNVWGQEESDPMGLVQIRPGLDVTSVDGLPKGFEPVKAPGKPN